MANCSSVQLLAIDSRCDASRGGIKKAWIAEYVEHAYTKDTSGKTITAITTGTSFVEIQFRKNTGSFTSTLTVDSANGVNYVQNEIILQFTRQEAEKRLAVNAMAQASMLVIVEDKNGTRWAFGFDAPVEATTGTGQTGTATTDGNYYQITLSDESEAFPYPLADDLVIPTA